MRFSSAEMVLKGVVPRVCKSMFVGLGSRSISALVGGLAIGRSGLAFLSSQYHAFYTLHPYTYLSKSYVDSRFL